ncbi:hypothetical protein Tco_1308693 [Tanacetum coccineum]
MTIDKSWTTLKNRTSSQFNDGLDAFLERCKDLLDEYNSATNEPPETKNELEELLAKASGKLYILVMIMSFNNGPVYMRWMYPSLNHTSKATGTYVNEAAATKHINTLFAAKVCLAAVKLVAKHPFCCKRTSRRTEEQPRERGECARNKTEVMKKVLDKNPVVGKEDEEYEESDDKEMKALDEHEEINDGDDSVE